MKLEANEGLGNSPNADRYRWVARVSGQGDVSSEEVQASDDGPHTILTSSSSTAGVQHKVVIQGAEVSPTIYIQDRPPPWHSVTIWLIGSVAASLLPFLPQLFHGINRGVTPSFKELLGTGDLFLVGLVLAISGVAEVSLKLNRMKQDQMLPVALVLLASLLVVAAQALWYADRSAQMRDNSAIAESSAILYGSILLFVVSVFCSSVCVRYSAGVR